jgi:curved DNA-binding protein
MGVERDATQDEIKRAYRKLARKYHPDVSKQADAEERFKEVGEAYEVLKDPEKRTAYDQLGANWKAGQEFHAPPGWDADVEFNGPGDADNFSDFFETLFRHEAQRGHAGGRQTFHARGEDHHAKVLIDLEDAWKGVTRTITLRVPKLDEHGRLSVQPHSLNVKIPKGIRQGQHIRLAGQGAPGHGGGVAGDLYLQVELKPHPLYRVDDRDVYLDLPIAPWEAALGATVKVPTPDGAVELKIPAGSKQGRKLRLKGRGIPARQRGDFYVIAQIALPAADTEQAKALYRKMEQELAFNPRSHLGV